MVNQELWPSLDIFNASQMSELNFDDKNYFIWYINYMATNVMVDNKITDDDKKALVHTLDDILLSCWFNRKPCSSKDFVWYFDRIFGNCFIFNSGFNETTGEKVDTKKSVLYGRSYGLKLELYVGFNEQLSLLNYVKGGVVKVENSSILIPESMDRILLKPGLN